VRTGITTEDGGHGGEGFTEGNEANEGTEGMIYARIKRKRVPRGPERLRGVRAALAVRVRAAQAMGAAQAERPVVLLPETLEEAKAAGASQAGLVHHGGASRTGGESTESGPGHEKRRRGKPFGRKPN
jgi:hypothetical protein